MPIMNMLYLAKNSGPSESIIFKMNANSNGVLPIPLGGYVSQQTAYSRKISVDGGTETTYSGTVPGGGHNNLVISISGYTAGSNHTVTIKPTTEDYGWAKAYAWYGTSSTSLLTEIIYDGSYMGYADSATNTGANFRYEQYRGCTNLINPADEYLPDTVTTIGAGFRGSQYTSCSKITYASEETLPDTVTSIGTNFRSAQYSQCSNLTEIKGWKDLSIGNQYYRQSQFYNCNKSKTVKVLSNVGYAGQSNTLNNSYVSQVQVPSAYLSNFTGATIYPRSLITDSKFVGY